MTLNIRHKITFSSTFLVFVIITVYFIFDISDHKKKGIDNYIKTGKAILHNSQYQIEHFAFINDYVELQRILNKIVMTNSEVRYAFIVDPKNQLLVHTFENGFPEDLVNANNNQHEHIQLIESQNDSFYDFSSPIAGGKLGTLRIGISRSNLINEIKIQTLTLLLILLGFILVGSIISYLISRQITLPIKKLVDLTQKVAQGNFNHRIKITTKDEVGELSKAFNSMCMNLTSLTNELHENIEQLNTKNIEFESLNEEYYCQNSELKDKLDLIQRMNEELKEAKTKAEEYDKLKTAFLANVSHEIRTPMNGIIGFTELLKNPELKLEKRLQYIEVIERSSQRMLELIHNLIDISLIESNQIKLKIEKSSLNQIVDNLFIFYQPEATKNQVKLIKKIPQADYSVYVDKNKIIQVISNLINNAFKFTHNGQITFGYTFKDQNICFFVKDTGVGISPSMQTIIFERFRQADNQSTANNGCGLGLAISKSIIELHGGKIWVESEPGQGSTFCFTIPYHEVIKDGFNLNHQTSLNSNSYLHETTILIVEDDRHNFLLLNEILTECGYKVKWVNNGLDAVKAIRKNPRINMVLMDIKMPLMNGLDATRLIKKITPNMPIVAQSAFIQPADQELAQQAGCVEFIGKPIRKDELIGIIGRYAPIV